MLVCTSFLSKIFITAIIVNPPERKLAKRTSVDWATIAKINIKLPLHKLSENPVRYKSRRVPVHDFTVCIDNIVKTHMYIKTGLFQNRNAPSKRKSPQCTLGCFPFFFRLRLPVGSADKCSIGQLICSMHFLHVKHWKFRWIKLSFSSCLTQWPILSNKVQKLAKFPSIALKH